MPTAREVVRFLKRKGFIGLLLKISKDAGFTLEEFRRG